MPPNILLFKVKVIIYYICIEPFLLSSLLWLQKVGRFPVNFGNFPEILETFWEFTTPLRPYSSCTLAFFFLLRSTCAIAEFIINLQNEEMLMNAVCMYKCKHIYQPLKTRSVLGTSSWYPNDTLVSCIRVLASNSTPTCN